MRRGRILGAGSALALASACAVTGPGLPVVLVPRPVAASPPCPSGAPCAEASAGAPSPTPALSPTASPTASPVLAIETDDPLDVAIAGPGYFVLAARWPATDLADLYFTRHGAFRWTYHAATDADARPGYRLESAEGLPVVGYARAGALATDPSEGRGGDFSSAFDLEGGRLLPATLAVDALANPGALPQFDFRGQLTVGSDAAGTGLPRDADGHAWSLFLAVAVPEDPAALVPVAGMPWWRYDPAGGALDVGLAGRPRHPGDLPRPVGDAVVLRPGWLE